MSPWRSPLVVGAIVLSVLVLAVFYVWDQRLSRAEAMHRAKVEIALQQGVQYREALAALEAEKEVALGVAAESQARYQASQARIAGLVRQRAQDSTSVAQADPDSLASALGLRATSAGWVADTGRIRHLAGLQAHVDWADAMIAELHVAMEAQRERADTLENAFLIANRQYGMAEARVLELEGLLRERQQLGRCRIIGPIPCPSRTLSFVLGVAGALAAVSATP